MIVVLINDEKLFQINGIDSYKYTGEKIYKMIKKHDITLSNLTKDTIFELIIATEKNPKGKFIFFSDNSGNDFNEYNNFESNPGVIQANNNNFCNDFFLEDSYDNYNNLKNNNNMVDNNGIGNENNNYINLNLTNNNLCNYSFKLKLRKYSNYSDKKSKFNLLNNNNNNNIKVIQNKKNKNKTKEKNSAETNKDNNNDNDKLLSKKRKKSIKKNSKKSSNISSKEKNNIPNPKLKPKKTNKTTKKKNYHN